jgi:UDP:flavonoid glycosyltransferase YjiC (YdhE family)
VPLFNQVPAVYAALFEAVAGEPMYVIATIGRNNDPSALPAAPGNVRVEQYIPQELLLPSCDVVVTHGGSGSMLGALRHGLPLLFLPQGADQFRNAERGQTCGVGQQLHPRRSALPPFIAPYERC